LRIAATEIRLTGNSIANYKHLALVYYTKDRYKLSSVNLLLRIMFSLFRSRSTWDKGIDFSLFTRTGAQQ